MSSRLHPISARQVPPQPAKTVGREMFGKGMENSSALHSLTESPLPRTTVVRLCNAGSCGALSPQIVAKSKPPRRDARRDFHWPFSLRAPRASAVEWFFASRLCVQSESNQSGCFVQRQRHAPTQRFQNLLQGCRRLGALPQPPSCRRCSRWLQRPKAEV